MSKRILFFLLIGLSFCQPLFGQRGGGTDTKYTEIYFGALKPQAVEEGTVLGIRWGRRIDERLSWGFEVSWFSSTFRKVTVVSDSVSGGVAVTTEEVELQFRTRIIPILFRLDYILPLSNESPIVIRASGSLGYAFIDNKEENFQLGTERSRTFNGTSWQLAAGAGLQISSRGQLFIEAFYNDADATRGQDASEEGLPTFQVLDVTGVGFKLGLRIGDLGI